MNEEKGKRIIGLDMHPDVFAAAALSADQSRVQSTRSGGSPKGQRDQSRLGDGVSLRQQNTRA